MDINLVIAALGALWLALLFVALVGSYRAKRRKEALLFGLTLLLIGTAWLLWNL